MSLANARQTILLGGPYLPATDAYTGATSGTSQAIPSERKDETVIYFESIGTTSGGTLLIEEANRATYTGVWSQIASVAASSFTGGAQVAYHVSPSAFAFIRVRISSNITGGGSVAVVMNQQGS